jgi:Na+-translocating ferredoxin:NAD+ oxidoreductase RNF subunit RnfB
MVAEELCIGCCRCSKVCPTDAIVGAAKQIHNVLREACTGCSSCVESAHRGAGDEAGAGHRPALGDAQAAGSMRKAMTTCERNLPAAVVTAQRVTGA